MSAPISCDPTITVCSPVVKPTTINTCNPSIEACDAAATIALTSSYWVY